jgi:hypothetical protein
MLSNTTRLIREPRIARRQRLGLAVAAAWLFAAAPAANAVLGGSPMPTPAGASVAPAATMRQAIAPGASGTSAATAPYTVRQTTLASGTVVREYVSNAGVVFGVAWDGPQIPALDDLFGSYFQQYLDGVKAARAARGGSARGPATVEQSGLVVHSAGHMGAFAGNAWLPQELPAGVSGSDIK